MADGRDPKFNTTKGDFWVDRIELREAKDQQAGLTEVGTEPARSPEAVASDKGKRAPITTDFDQWVDNKGKFDFPSIDTPTSSPEVLEKDRPFISEDDLVSDVEDDFF